MLDYTANLLCQVLAQKHVDSWECLKRDSLSTTFNEFLVFLGKELLSLFPVVVFLLGFIYIVHRSFKNIPRPVVLLTAYASVICWASLTVLPFLALYDPVYWAILLMTYPILIISLAFLVSIQSNSRFQVANPSLLTLIMSGIAFIILLLIILRFFPQEAFAKCTFTSLYYITHLLTMSSFAFGNVVDHSIVFFNFWTAEKLEIYEEGKKIGYAIKKGGQWIEYVDKPELVHV